MAYLPIATVNLTLLTVAVRSANFGTPIFYTVTKAFTERVREYTSAPDVATDLGTASNAYRAALSFFGQSPQPSLFKVGRIAANATITPAVVEEGLTYSFNIGVNTSTTNSISHLALEDETAEEVVDAWVAAVNAQYDGQITATKNGTGSAAAMTITPDTAQYDYIIGETINASVDYTASESVLDAHEAAKGEDGDFYFVTSESKLQADVLALAAAVNAEDRMYFVSLGDADILTPLTDVSTDTAAQLSEFNYDKVSWNFSQLPNNYTELGIIGRFCTYEPGTADWYAKQIAGYPVSRDPVSGWKLNNTQKTYIQQRAGNYVETEGGIDVYKKGVTTSGQQIGIVWFRDFYKARLVEGIQNWRINRVKVPYDQPGIDAAENVVRQVTEQYVSTAERPHAVQRFVTRFPRRQDVSFANLAAGHLQGSITIYLTGSIFTVELDGLLTYETDFTGQ